MVTLLTPPGVQQPSHDQTIFRYMSFAKFINLVESCAVYFPCIQKLKDQDKLEGLLDLSNFAFRGIPQESEMLGQFRTKLGDTNWAALGSPNDFSSLFRAIAESSHNSYFASCWHIANHESILMWNRYAPGYESVAIQSTVGKVIESIQNDAVVRYGIVNYDPQTMFSQYGNGSECFYKHPLYLGESECRFLAYGDNPSHLGVGMPILVNLPSMIDRIYVAPDSDPWFASLVESIATKANLPTPILRTTTRK